MEPTGVNGFSPQIDVTPCFSSIYNTSLFSHKPPRKEKSGGYLGVKIWG